VGPTAQKTPRSSQQQNVRTSTNHQLAFPPVFPPPFSLPLLSLLCTTAAAPDSSIGWGLLVLGSVPPPPLPLLLLLLREAPAGLCVPVRTFSLSLSPPAVPPSSPVPNSPSPRPACTVPGPSRSASPRRGRSRLSASPARARHSPPRHGCCNRILKRSSSSTSPPSSCACACASWLTNPVCVDAGRDAFAVPLRVPLSSQQQHEGKKELRLSHGNCTSTAAERSFTRARDPAYALLPWPSLAPLRRPVVVGPRASGSGPPFYPQEIQQLRTFLSHWPALPASSEKPHPTS
jgi:hypothetical protein